jgi:2,6-dihydroxypyridine 3-monooxygenase
VAEADVSDETRVLLDDALCYSVMEHSHICMYPIPGTDGRLDRGHRLLNYVWYRNVAQGPALDEMMTDTRGHPAAVSVPAGRVQQRYIDEVKSSTGLLPAAAAELVARTTQPYIQSVIDVVVPQMAFGRVALIGDAAFVARPHAAAGTAKAAADAWALADSLAENGNDVITALKAWEPARLALGEDLIRRNAAMGARAQFEGTWDPRDPSLHFGLYGPDR